MPEIDVSTKSFDLNIPPGIALGCAKFGSVNGISQREALGLMDIAYRRGVRVFDTAASYGQGDSERIVGSFARQHPDLCIITKLGKVVPLKAQILSPVKPLMRAISRRSKRTAGAIRDSRGGSLGTNFDLVYLKTQFAGSLRRLGLTKIPVVLLHSPPASVITDGAAIEFLETARKAGSIGMIGVSVDDSAAAEAAIVDDRIQVIQMPFASGDAWALALLPQLKSSGKIVVAREIFRDADISTAEGRAGRLFEALSRLMNCDGVTSTLLGTTRRTHLDELLDMYDLMAADRKTRI